MNQKNTKINAKERASLTRGLSAKLTGGSSNKGITLIALVITIIVLLILAGVTISMVLGDDGIIAQAEGAADTHKNASEMEQANIDVLPIEMNWTIKGTAEKYATNGIITGINKGETVADLKLPDGYKVKSWDGTTTLGAADTLKTGLQVIDENDNLVARTVIYGDVGLEGDGFINAVDASNCSSVKDTDSDYVKIAADVNFDGYINIEDREMVMAFSGNKGILNQKIKANSVKSIIIETEEEYYRRQIKRIVGDKFVSTELNKKGGISKYKIHIENPLTTENPLTVASCVSKNNERYIAQIESSQTGEYITEGNVQEGDKLLLEVYAMLGDTKCLCEGINKPIEFCYITSE